MCKGGRVEEAQRRYHEVADIFPLMTGADFDALKADIAAHGQREPIWLHPDGRIIDGRNRHRACVELGITPTFRTWDGGDGLVAFVVSLNLHRRHLSESQRAMVAAKLANMPRGGDRKTESKDQLISRFDAAEMLSVSVPSVMRARAVQSTGAPELVAAVERGDVAVSAAAEVATLPTEWQRVIVEHGEVAEAARELRTGKAEAVEERVKPHVANNNGNNEWYTPAEYVEAARRVLGTIDLDPASSAQANEVVKAARFYTAEDDGLAQPWAGRVWMNPPYAAGLVNRFAEKLAAHHEAGEVEQAVVLVNNATETAWFHRMARAARCICFPRGRVRFWQSDGPLGAPLQGQAVIYMGQDVDGFAEAFNGFGLVVTL